MPDNSICGCTQIITNNVFLVGPHYNSAETNELLRIATLIESSGYTVYMPHRDGLNYDLVFAHFKAQNNTDEEAAKLTANLSHEFNVYKLSRSNLIIGNINTYDPATIALLSIASISCIPTLLYRDDTRSFDCGIPIEPTIRALTECDIITSCFDIISAIETALSTKSCICISSGLNKLIDAGSKIIKGNFR